MTVPAAAEALGLGRQTVAARLARLARRGWIQRARRGLYMVLPIEVEPGERTVAEDPWIVAREAFAPCYVGGWSAAEHWGLTEQLFRSTLVVTGMSVRARSQVLLGHEFRLVRVPRSRINGSLVSVWRGSERVRVSSPERTIADGLRNPELCGGIRHLFQIMHEYGGRPEHDFKKLTGAVAEVASGAAWKRLGYLTELLWPHEQLLTDQARAGLSAGNARLDPAIDRKGRLVRRWRLWVNVNLESSALSSAP